jgi:hypothetical protein
LFEETPVFAEPKCFTALPAGARAIPRNYHAFYLVSEEKEK